MTNYSCFVTAGGIGDSVCGLYAVSGLADSLPPGDTVTFYTRHRSWLGRFVHPGVRLADHRAGGSMGVDMDRDYNRQLRESRSRKQWYADALCDGLGLARCSPQKPRMRLDNPAVLPGYVPQSYVVLVPFSDFDSRTWPVVQYLKLASELVKAGWRVVVIDRGQQKLDRYFGGDTGVTTQYFWGHSGEWVGDLLLNAALVVGNDSGMAHLAALLDVPTVAVMAQLSPRLVFSHTDVQTVLPRAGCSPCAWQGYRGWIPSCDSLGCAALAGVGFEEVLGRAMSILRNQP